MKRMTQDARMAWVRALKEGDLVIAYQSVYEVARLTPAQVVLKGAEGESWHVWRDHRFRAGRIVGSQITIDPWTPEWGERREAERKHRARQNKWMSVALAGVPDEIIDRAIAIINDWHDQQQEEA